MVHRFLLAAVLAFVSSGALSQERGGAGPSARNVLAISWQPAFCEGQSRRPECRSQTESRPDASRFSLHGLWPQPRSRQYCGEAARIPESERRDWDRLPQPELSPALRERLAVAMPGTQSFLDRHEWARHGSCYGGGAEEYFAESIAMLDAVNASAVGRLFAARLGQQVTAEEIRAAFDEAFGAGAGERVRVSCRNDGKRRLVNELTIGLAGEIAAAPDLPVLIAASRPIDPGCPGGIVDAAGSQ